ncbi:MAG: hypothetical protein JSW08_02000 [archaeon]|nr:MAG: hypothetical protein JSW08_02000 [archaeon]
MSFWADGLAVLVVIFFILVIYSGFKRQSIKDTIDQLIEKLNEKKEDTKEEYGRGLYG